MQALLFDLDGTLVDSIPLWTEANLHVLADHGSTLDTDTFLTDFYRQGLHHHGILEKCGIGIEQADQFYRERNDLFAKLLTQKIEWIGNARTILEQCAAKMPLGLMTGSTHRFIEAINERLHLSEIFTEIVTYDETGAKMKPDPYGLLLLADKLNVDPTACMYVGDMLVDVQAAKAAGMKSCLIPTKDTPEGAAAEADIVLQKIGDLAGILGKTFS